MDLSPTTAPPFDYYFFHSQSTYIMALHLHYYYHKQPANIKTLRKIDGRKSLEAFEANFKETIQVKHAKECFCWKGSRMYYNELIYVLKDNLTLEIDDYNLAVYYSAGKEEKAQELLNWFMKFKTRQKRTVSIHLVVTGATGLELTALKLKKPVLSIQSNYNDDLFPVHKVALSSLKTKNKSGLILFHGSPGTGKSTYIRYLIHQRYKPVIFLPPKLAGDLDSPGVVSLLIDNPNTVFVIEDAEQLITSRENGRNSSISMLLNLTDGLLGESLGIQVIATFNTHISNIDKALLRKGRLIALYEFKELQPNKANKLLEQITNDNYAITKPLSLADIYNIKQNSFHFKQERNSIGFLNTPN